MAYGNCGMDVYCGYTYMLGIRAKWDGLEIDPCLPKELLPAKVTRVFRGKKYNITITKNEKIFIKDDDKNVNVVI